MLSLIGDPFVPFISGLEWNAILTHVKRNQGWWCFELLIIRFFELDLQMLIVTSSRGWFGEDWVPDILSFWWLWLPLLLLFIKKCSVAYVFLANTLTKPLQAFPQVFLLEFHTRWPQSSTTPWIILGGDDVCPPAAVTTKTDPGPDDLSSWGKTNPINLGLVPVWKNSTPFEFSRIIGSNTPWLSYAISDSQRSALSGAISHRRRDDDPMKTAPMCLAIFI